MADSTNDPVYNDALILSCLGLVREIALKDYRCAHRGRDDRLDDLVQEGSLGLLDAVRTFRPGRGPFPAWAALYIHAFIRRALQAESHQCDHGASDEGLATVTDSYIGPEVLTRTEEEARAVRAAIADLPDEDKYILLRIYYDGATGAEIAADHGLTPAAISYRKKAALAKARARLRA